MPPAILTHLAEQIGEAPDVLADYASRDPTRREHLSEIQRVFQFHPFTMQTYRDLSRWLMPITLILTGVLIIGIRMSSRFNLVVTSIKITIVLFFIIFGLFLIKTSNWSPFIPSPAPPSA